MPIHSRSLTMKNFASEFTLQLSEIPFPECSCHTRFENPARSSGDAVCIVFVFSAPVIIRVEYTSCVCDCECVCVCDDRSANSQRISASMHVVSCVTCIRVLLGFRQVCDRRARSYKHTGTVRVCAMFVFAVLECVNTHHHTEPTSYFERIIKAEHLSASSLQIVVIR